MNIPRVTRLALCLLVVAVSFAAAAPFDARTVSADARWVLHLDADGLRQTALWHHVRERIQQEDLEAKINAWTNLLGIDPRTDVHGLTLYGPDSEEENSIVLLNTDYDRRVLMDALKTNERYTSKQVEGRTLYRFRDDNKSTPEKDKLLWGHFYNTNTLLIGHKPATVVHAAAVLDGKTPSLTNGRAPDWLGKPAGAAFFAASADLVALKALKGEAAFLQCAAGLSLSLGETQRELQLHASVLGQSEEAAKKMLQVGQGLIALATMSDDKDAAHRPFLKFAQEIRLERLGNRVVLSAACPVEEVIEALPRHAQ